MLQTEVMAILRPANRERAGAGLEQLHGVPIGCSLLAMLGHTAILGTIPCCKLELWLFKAQPIGSQGAWLQQLQLIPIGRQSSDPCDRSKVEIMSLRKSMPE